MKIIKYTFSILKKFLSSLSCLFSKIGVFKLSIVYPGKILCPNCKNFINIDYSGSVSKTSDLLSLQVEVPQSSNSGSDARKEKQSIGNVAHYLLICKHCTVILGSIPGHVYLWQNSKD